MIDPNEQEFKYKPEIDYRSVSAQDHERCSELLKAYQKGYQHPLESHILNADGLRSYLDSAAVTEEIYAEFRFHSKEIDDAIMSIVRGYSEFEMELTPRQLDMLAQREYFNLFSDIDMDQEKIDFIKMMKTYEHVKKFNEDTREAWNFLKGIFEKIKTNTVNRLFLEQVLMYKIYPRLELTEQTDLLLRRMAYILKISNEEKKMDKWEAQGEYTSMIKYNVGSLFHTDLDGIIGDHTGPTQQTTSGAGSDKAWKEYKETAIVNPYFLDTRGAHAFTQSYLYTIKMDEDRVVIETQKIRKALYLETHLGAEDSALRSDLIRKFISQAKSKDRISEYDAFLHEYFDFTNNTMLLHFMEHEDLNKELLLYHFGPVYFLKVVMHFMREGRTGFIHRHLKGDQMVRELPFEYLKFILKDWWDVNVFQKVPGVERNHEEKYKDIVQLILKMWRQDQTKVIGLIKRDQILLRAFKLHDLKSLEPILENEISYLFYSMFVRFLGRDFLYIPLAKTVQQSAARFT